MRHPGGAAILALDQQNRVCLLRQYRHSIGKWIWELPAGVIEKGEQPIATAKRELREEAGVEADEWQPLFSILPTPGFCNEELFLYQARHLTAVGTTPNADEQKAATVFLQTQAKAHGEKQPAEKSWSDFCHVLFNVKEFVFLN